MDYSFDIKSFNQYWATTKKTVQEFFSDDLNGKLARDCAQYLWHLCDWYYEEHKATLNFTQLSDLQGTYGKRCPSLRVIRDVCNGTKHCKLKRTRNPKVQATKKREGGLSSAFNQGFDASALVVELKDGSELYFTKAVEKSFEFWKGLIEP
ncbi:MAG: hypothetical protein GY705_11350 [Bacteroidetes bacterium]|nr:hypothetical protein [Bacteroidota bacterium]